MIRNIPTFSTGIALTPGESLYPYLWKGLVGMWCPSVGKQGNKLLDLSLYNRKAFLQNGINFSLDLTVSGGVIVADTIESGHPASNAINNSSSSSFPWSSTNTSYPHWIRYDFGVANEKIINQYTIRARSDFPAPNRLPRDFTLQGSNNTIDWTILDTRTGITFSNGERKTFNNFSEGKNNVIYRYYRIHATANNGDANWCQIEELELMESKARYVPSINGYVLNYDGVDDFIDIGNIAEINETAQDFSVSIRVKTSASSGVIWSYDTNNILQPSQDAYFITPSALAIGGVGTTGQINTGISINDGLWHHLVVVLKRGNLFLYKDSVKVFSASVPHVRADYPSTHNFRLADNANVAFLSGDIGDTLIYNRALEQSEVTDLFNNRTPLVPFIISALAIGEASQIESENLQITDNIIVTDTIIQEASGILISDSINIQDTTIEELDNLEISDNIIITSTNTDAKNISKIISINPLIFVTDTSPIEIIKIDITDPQNITWIVQSILGINSAKDMVATDEFIYIAGETGQVIKVEIADLANQTIIDLNDTDDLLTIQRNSNFGITYAGTENNVGELYVIDERVTFTLDSDFQVIAPINFKLNTSFNIVKTFRVDSNFQLLEQKTFAISVDFKCIDQVVAPVFPPEPPDPTPPPVPSPVANIDTIKPTVLIDYKVFIDNVELQDTDLILNSISITHSLGQQSTASFNLSRKHDQLNTTLKGISSIITNQNAVKITIKGITEFNGNVSELNPQYGDTDFVAVSALALEKTNKFNTITMSLPKLDTRLSIYDILISNPRIFNPLFDPNDENSPKKFKGVRVPLGNKTTQQVTSFRFSDNGIPANIFNDENQIGKIAKSITDGTFLPLFNNTYFWSAGVHKFGKVKLGDVIGIDFRYIGTSLSPVSEDLWELINAPHWRQRIFPDEIIKLGNGVVPISDFNDIVDNPTDVHFQLQSRGFLTGGLGIITTKFKKTKNYTELKLTGISSNQQREIYEIIERDLGFTIGEAPFKDINVRNGVKVTKPKYVDEPSVLSSITEASFNFLQYAEEVARLEYEKILNINGDILPETTCALTCTIDAYLYYGISLANRINIDNTTESGIYNNSNGFPVSVKSITITSSDRKVTFNANNIKSAKELIAIDAQFPNENDDQYNEEQKRIVIAGKSNLRTLKTEEEE